jgi:hypothetical protein
MEVTRSSELVLIDMAVLALAVNAMRCQSMIGNTALVLEAEIFGLPSLRAKWKKKYGARPEDIGRLDARRCGPTGADRARDETEPHRVLIICRHHTAC